MKTKIFLSFSLLCFVITAKAQVYNGNISLGNQAQVDTFNYTEINGDLSIDFYPVNLGYGINNLNHLSMLKKINGSFRIRNSYDSIINYKGLNGLKYIRHMYPPINYNEDSIMYFTGLDSIERIDTLIIGPTNASFIGLESLKHIGYLSVIDYWFVDFDSLTLSFQGLNNVETIRDIELIGTKLYYKLEGLEKLREITGTFDIRSLGNHVDFTGMNSIHYINNFLVELVGMKPFSFNGLSTLRQIDTLEIKPFNSTYLSYDFNDLSGIRYLQKLYMIQIGEQCNTLNLDFMSNITMLKELTLKSTYAFENLNGLRNIQLITGKLDIQFNSDLMNCCGIKYLLQSGGVHGPIYIQSNGHLACHSPFFSFECDNVDTIINSFCNVQRDSVNLVEYKFYIDNNSNSVFDNNDAPVTNKRISLTYPDGNIYTNLTDENGRNRFFVNRGNYQFAVISAIPNYTVSPVSASKTFTTLSNADSIQFIAHPTSIFNDVSIETVIGGSSRPGRENGLLINVANIGTQVSNGFLKFKLDNRASVLSANPASSFSIGDTLVWNINNLFQLNHQNIYVQYLLASNLQNRDTIYHYAKFVNNVTDATPANNSFVAPDPIITSYDPNDKSVSNQFITPGMVASGDYLTYTIRFQNTGNDTAFRVEIKDTLSDNLDWNSIDMIGASHPYTFKQENGKYITFTFNNILLPDSNVNEIKSHGFVSFKIKPKSTLPLGAAIPNTGYIYFDLNAPVKTNTVQTTVQLLSNTITNKQFDGKLSVYPNPNTGEFMLQLNSKQSGNLFISITNLSGQIVYSSKENHTGLSTFTINSTHLEAGVYLVTVQLNNESTSQKLVVIK